ncbi:hypothetical protein LZ578_04790 [Jeotgalibaca sp. MA1X17-3]|uniref:hypothetical protein n=1 Tax=Jeotgalibaca sp. MA1X17-3 TaxID=2908211 RepID=UPI001F42C0CD|nr:hypothetical protein [Jeotgalibaca sp. MA1X17-3]UJF16432.1 hypothetical protein LZ578_04790 [Jeotgalibaca sp. MA1X17-3]
MRDKKLKDAVVFTVLSLLYPAYLFATRQPGSITNVSLFLALFFPIVAIIFSLNVIDPRFKWGLTSLNIVIFILFAFYTIQILL